RPHPFTWTSRRRPMCPLSPYTTLFRSTHSVWAKKQGHTWFAAEVVVPEAARGKTFVLRFVSQWQDRAGTTDPQCLAYLDGKIAQDRKSTRLNSSHVKISYAVFCLNKTQ